MSQRVEGRGEPVLENVGQITVLVAVGTAELVGTIRVGLSTIPITAKGAYVWEYTTRVLYMW